MNDEPSTLEIWARFEIRQRRRPEAFDLIHSQFRRLDYTSTFKDLYKSVKLFKSIQVDSRRSRLFGFLFLEDFEDVRDLGASFGNILFCFAVPIPFQIFETFTEILSCSRSLQNLEVSLLKSGDDIVKHE